MSFGSGRTVWPSAARGCAPSRCDRLSRPTSATTFLDDRPPRGGVCGWCLRELEHAVDRERGRDDPDEAAQSGACGRLAEHDDADRDRDERVDDGQARR